MKTYEFHSVLPPEAVFERLLAHAVAVKYLGMRRTHMVAERFLYQRDGERFWLSYTGVMPMTGFIPFSGAVRAEGVGSVITGGFSVWRALWRLLIGMACVIFLAELLLRFPLWFALLGAALGFAWLLFAMWLMQGFFGKRRKAIVSFIEENLLE